MTPMSIAAFGRRLRHWRGALLDHGRTLEDWAADLPEDYCSRCGTSAGPGSVTPRGCAFCVKKKIAWHRITRLSAYAPPMDESIKAMKFAGDWAQAQWLARQLAAILDEPANPRKLIVCAVPMHRFRRWSRGYNQAELMAEALAAERRWTILPLLKRVRHTSPQSTLPATRRLQNLRGAFETRAIDLTGYDILLVDDVKTTGTTLSACCDQLKQAGATTIHAVVAAVADPKGQQFTTI